MEDNNILHVFTLTENMWHFKPTYLSSLLSTVQHPACLPITKTTYSFILLIITVEQVCLFFFCWTERSHLCFALFTTARDCLRCFSAAARLLMEAKPAYNSLWQVIQTHNIKIRSSHWSSQLKKPPQAIARTLLAVAAEFRRLKIYMLFHGEIPRYFVETQNYKWSNHIRFVLVSFLFSGAMFFSDLSYLDVFLDNIIILMMKRSKWINSCILTSEAPCHSKRLRWNLWQLFLSYVDPMFYTTRQSMYCLKC